MKNYFFDSDLSLGWGKVFTPCFVDKLPVFLREKSLAAEPLNCHSDLAEESLAILNSQRYFDFAQYDKVENSVSYITPEPQMPRLKAELLSLDEETQVTWELQVKYDRPDNSGQSQDTVTITPSAGSLAGDVPWDISSDANWTSKVTEGFFGGDATLTATVSGNGLSNQKLTLKFKIGGKNPDDPTCKSYINQVAGSSLWYAYAIAKHESKDYDREGSRYNQFRSTKKLGFPLHHSDTDGSDGKPGGFGIFQVTGTSTNPLAPIPREQIWNWKKNVEAGIVIQQAKRVEGVSWMQSQRQQAAAVSLPSHRILNVTFSDGTARFMEDAVSIKLYNGASRGRNADSGYADGFRLDTKSSGHYCYWRNLSSEWALSRWNNPPSNLEPFNYVERVCQEID